MDVGYRFWACKVRAPKFKKIKAKNQIWSIEVIITVKL